MSVQEVDLLCVGAGGGAYPAAFRLAKAGKNVVMVDSKGVMSGNCLYEGCVPSKAVRETAALYQNAQRFQPYGLTGNLQVDFPALMQHKDAIQNRRYAQHSVELAAEPRIRLSKGVARLIDLHTVKVDTDVGTDIYHAQHILIASGSDVFIPPLPGAELCLTSHDLYKPSSVMKSLPTKMIIVGGGYVGLETATFFAALGTEVTLLQKGEQILNGIDPTMVNMLLPLLPKGLELRTNVEVQRVEAVGTGRRVVWLQNGEEQQLEVDAVLLAVGRRPVIPEGTEALGIDFDHHGIQVGPSLQTRFPHIYAAGDVNGHVPLFHAAVRQSMVAGHNILAGNIPTDYADFDHVPTTIFTLPAAAYIGLTPAKVPPGSLLEAHYAFSEDSRAQILERMDGEIRLFFEPGSMRIRGAWIVGIDAGSLIGQVGTAIASGMTVYDLARFADQHPMSAEGVGNAARSLL